MEGEIGEPRLRMLWVINNKDKVPVFKDQTREWEWENNQEWTTNVYPLIQLFATHLTSASHTWIESSAIFFHLPPTPCPTPQPAALFISHLLATLPGSVQGKEKMKLKSMNFTSAKGHNFHPLPLVSKYQVLKIAVFLCKIFWHQSFCHSNLHHHLIQVLIISCPKSISASLSL